jgi:copper transport protein
MRRRGTPTAFAIGALLSSLTAMAIAVGFAGIAAVHAAEASDDSFFTRLHTARAMANVTILPGRVGPVDISIQLETADEAPLSASAVSVTLTDEASGVAPQTAQAVRTADDQWLVRMSAPRAGRWMLGLGITLPDLERVDVESPVLIR